MELFGQSALPANPQRTQLWRCYHFACEKNQLLQGLLFSSEIRENRKNLSNKPCQRTIQIISRNRVLLLCNYELKKFVHPQQFWISNVKNVL